MTPTPGPWILDPDERPGMEWNIHVVEASNPDNRICFMASNGPNEANARLISAAPDLLAALKEAARYVEYLETGSFVGPGMPRDALAQIKFAIAKAESNP